jgi:hypothetical protein
MVELPPMSPPLPYLPTAIFVDILGFASLVENEPSLEPLADAPPASFGTFGYNFATHDMPDFVTIFGGFHQALDFALARAETIGRVTSFVFSDSAFVVFDSLYEGTSFAKDLMFRMLDAGVPVRIGVGTGTFLAMRMMTDSDATQKRFRHSSQFLGSSVIRAYKAESCGVPGMRILLHPTTPLDGPLQNQILTIPSDGNRVLRCPVTHELNYLRRHARPSHMSPEMVHYNDAIRHAVTRLGIGAPENSHHHYSESRAAVDRMFEQYKDPPD